MPQGDFLTGDRERDRRNVDMLLAAVAHLYGKRGIDDTLRAAVDGAVRVTDGERGFLLLTSDDGSLRVRVARDRHGIDLAGDPSTYSHSVAEDVWSTGSPRITVDTEGIAATDLPKSVRRGGLRAVLAVPIPGEASPRGVLYVDSHRKATGFTPFDQAVFESLAVVAGTAIRRAEAEQVQQDLEAAREIQARMAPRGVALPAGFDLAFVGKSAEATSGDYHDVIPLADGTLCLVVGDVVGHGLGASLHMASVRAALRTLLRARPNPFRALHDLNAWLCDEMTAREFMTMALVVVDPRTSTYRWASAGQSSLHWRTGEGVRELRRTGPPLAVAPDARHRKQGPVPLGIGDALVLYTDGLPEAFDASRQIWGDERFHASIAANASRDPSAKSLLDGVLKDLYAHIGSPALADDVTCVVLRRTAPGARTPRGASTPDVGRQS